MEDTDRAHKGSTRPGHNTDPEDSLPRIQHSFSFHRIRNYFEGNVLWKIECFLEADYDSLRRDPKRERVLIRAEC